MTFLPTPNICLRKSPYSTLAFLLCKGRALISRFLKKNLEKRGGRYICVPLAEYKPKYTLDFQKSTFSLSVKTVDGSLSESVTITGVYTYDDPIVTLKATFDDETQTINRVRDGDTIGFTDGPTFKKK